MGDVTANHEGGFIHGVRQFSPALSWASIALAVFTALCQGMVSALTFMTESSGQWTFRFRLALAEHWWWTVVSVLLLISLVMSALAFAGGRGGDPVSVLALSSATFLAMIQYMLPAWKQRHYTRTRWYAWTGDSRTAIKKDVVLVCKDAASWARLVRKCRSRLSRLQRTPSDYYGWRLWPLRSIPDDPTDVFRVLTTSDAQQADNEHGKELVGVYENFDQTSSTASLLWGRHQNFRRRVSRAVSSMPMTLLRSTPRTSDGYDGRGLTLAMGVLGRNKGLQPWKLVYRSNQQIASQLENSSTWTPRPSKVLRSFYKQALHSQYHGLGTEFVDAAVELALLVLDMPSHDINRWLSFGVEHQSVEIAKILSDLTISIDQGERAEALAAHYESSYVAMIISLNALRATSVNIARPDVICTGLLLKAREFHEPSWWNAKDVQTIRAHEIECLSQEVEWRTAAANLLGLSEWPVGFDAMPSVWNDSKRG